MTQRRTRARRATDTVEPVEAPTAGDGGEGGGGGLAEQVEHWGGVARETTRECQQDADAVKELEKRRNRSGQ